MCDLWHNKGMPKVSTGRGFTLKVEFHREEDGRWLVDIPALPGVTAYGRTKRQAMAGAQALALRLIADRLEHSEAVPGEMQVSWSCSSSHGRMAMGTVGVNIFSRVGSSITRPGYSADPI